MAQCSETPWRLFSPCRPPILPRSTAALVVGVPVAHGARRCSVCSRRRVIARPCSRAIRVAAGPRAPVLGATRPASQVISTGADLTAGENPREVRCLSRMSSSLLHGRRRQGGGATQTCPSIVRWRHTDHGDAEAEAIAILVAASRLSMRRFWYWRSGLVRHARGSFSNSWERLRFVWVEGHRRGLMTSPTLSCGTPDRWIPYRI